MALLTDNGMNCHENFDVILSWSTANHAGSTVIAGVLRNIRYALMEHIEVRVTLLDAKGEKVCRGTDLVSGRLVRDEQTSFNVTLPAAAVPGCRLAFTCKYTGDETAWQQSFETDFAG